MSSYCRSCGARLLWVETVNGRRMPLDWYPDAHGQMVSTGQTADDGTPVYKVLAHGTEPAPGLARHTSHFATCPQADEWRTV